jgi:hypothetical protein
MHIRVMRPLSGCQQKQAATVMANPNADGNCDVAMLSGCTRREARYSAIEDAHSTAGLQNNYGRVPVSTDEARVFVTVRAGPRSVVNLTELERLLQNNAQHQTAIQPTSNRYGFNRIVALEAGTMPGVPHATSDSGAPARPRRCQ